jgi:hypothetical protein
MEYPVSEIDLWALVFYEEQQELEATRTGKRKPDNQSEEEQIEQFKKIMKPRMRGRK